MKLFQLVNVLNLRYPISVCCWPGGGEDLALALLVADGVRHQSAAQPACWCCLGLYTCQAGYPPASASRCLGFTGPFTPPSHLPLFLKKEDCLKFEMVGGGCGVFVLGFFYRILKT